MRTKLFITCMIMTLLSMITLASCSSSIDDTLTESEFAIDDLSPNFNCEPPQEMINTLTLTFNVTPTVITDSCELFATRNEIDFTASAHSSTYTVPLNSNRIPDGMFSVHFKVRNVTVNYKIENPAWFPTAPGSIDFEVEVNKNATNTIKIAEASVSGIAPRQTLRVGVCITSDEGGSTHTYTVSFLAAIEGAHVVIKDGSRVD